MSTHLAHSRALSPPLVVNVALTGMVGRTSAIPHLPVTPEMIVADAEACVRAGATILHLHARDCHEEPEWRKEAYGAIIASIRQRCPGVVICVTTSGRRHTKFAQRSDVLQLTDASRPDMASLTLGSLNFRDQASVTDPEMIVALANEMRLRGIKPELEIFDSGMASLAHTLIERDVLRPPLYANVLLGSTNTAPATARSLVHLVDALPPATVWAAAGIGAFQLAVNGLAIFMGGHVRTGLEDNALLDREMRRPATNVALVQRVARIAALAGRRVATCEEARTLLSLDPPPPPR